MFSFLKNKKYLRDCIPEHYVDIHSHLLPGIDDGAKSIEDSSGLIQALQGFGFEQFITTPHVIPTIWDNTPATISEAHQATVANLKAQAITAPLQAAAEYLMDDSFVKLFQSEQLLTLKDNYVLVEMSYMNAPMQLYDILFELQVAGYQPVLAHPERYLFYHTNFKEYHKLQRAGCHLQLNLLSTVGYYGKAVADTAQQLLEQGLIEFVGSDVHHQQHVRSFERKLLFSDVVPLVEAMERNAFFRRE